MYILDCTEHGIIKCGITIIMHSEHSAIDITMVK